MAVPTVVDEETMLVAACSSRLGSDMPGCEGCTKRTKPKGKGVTDKSVGSIACGGGK